MGTTISHAGGEIEPTAVLGYSADRATANIIHPILGRANPDVTMRPAALRTGTLSMGFHGDAAELDSKTAEDAHATGEVFTLVSTDVETISMSYVVAGAVTRMLEDESRDAWIVDVEFQEVSA